jgi:hypothetical protein
METMNDMPAEDTAGAIAAPPVGVRCPAPVDCGSFRVLAVSDPHRGVAETTIRKAYQRHYAARIDSFCPWLVSIGTGPWTQPGAVAGFRPAADGRIFAETYLDAPVESILGCDRDRVVEVGNVAMTAAGTSRKLIVVMTSFLHGAGFHRVVCTLVPVLVNAFRRLALPLEVLAPARIERLNAGEREGWGTYYSHAPLVCWGDIGLGYRLLADQVDSDPSLRDLFQRSVGEGHIWRREWFRSAA